MKKLKISSLYDNVHFIFILLILLILSLKYWYFIFLYIIYLIILRKRTSIFIIGVLLSLLICIVNLKYYIPHNEKTFDGIVTEVSNNKAVVNTNMVDVVIYHDGRIQLGDYGTFTVKEVDYDTELFNYSEYLLNKNVLNYYKVEDFTYKDNYFVLGKINEFFKNVTGNNPYVNSLVFADKSELEIYEETTYLGLSHLMSISGMHISLLLSFLNWFLRRIFYFEKPVNIIIIIFSMIYLVIVDFELTVLRAVLMVVLNIIFKDIKLLFTKLDILSIIGIFLLVINPRTLFLLSFELSFFISFTIIIFGSKINTKIKVFDTFLLSLISFLVSFPFVVNTNYEVNLLTILIGPFYVLYFELILYPATLMITFFPQLATFFNFVYAFFEESIILFSTIDLFNLIFGKLDIVAFILYEVLIYFILYSFEVKRGRSLIMCFFLLFITLLYYKNSFNPFYQIKMYDVGQGDSIALMLPNGSGVVLVDCYNDITEYLMRDGVKKVDMIFLSHGHSDHTNALTVVIDRYKVENIYSSYYDNTSELAELKKKYNIKLLKEGNNIKYKDLNINILGPLKSYKNENDNSLVMMVNYDDFRVLFTGDIEEEAEKDLVVKYKNSLKADVLKVAHHGSKTSSNATFLSYVNPKYYLISVGKNNSYNFPNNQYLLQLSKIYRTDINNSITILKRKRKLIIL